MKTVLKIVSMVLFLCLFASCASIIASTLGMSQEDKAYRIVPKNVGENRAIAVFYGYEYLKEREDKRAETAMREPNYNNIHKFGYISIRTQASTAGTGNLKSWLFIVQDKNKNEIYRSNGSDSSPSGNINDVGKSYITTWWNLHNIYLTENVEFPLYLRVVNALNEAIDIVIEKK
jgi:hypothetical protein